jgi:GNAT superfamily N-acetyltransferase
MNIRRGNENDLNTVTSLWKEFADELYPDEKNSVSIYTEQMKNMLKSPIYAVFLAFDGNTAIGFSDAIVINDAVVGGLCGYGRFLYVKPEYRKTFLGARLYKTLLQWAKKQGIISVKTYCTDRMIKFYRGLGYSSTETLMYKKMFCKNCPKNTEKR